MMKIVQSHRIQFLSFLNIVLILAGSLNYAGIEIQPLVLKSIRNAKKIPNLKDFSDEQMKGIFRDIAKNNETQECEPFLSRINHFHLLLPQIKETYKKIKVAPLCEDGAVNKLECAFNEISTNFIRGNANKVKSEFSNLISLLQFFGSKIYQDQNIPPIDKEAILENLNETAFKSYSEILMNKPKSLKDAIIEANENKS